MIEELVKKYDIPVVEVFSFKSYIDAFEGINSWKNKEGIILVMNDGSRYKIKGEEYVLKHRARDDISKERIVWKAILDGTFDDILPLLSDRDRETAKEMEAEFWQLYKGTLDHLNKVVHDTLSKYSDKKSFATDRDHGLTKTETRFVFASFNKKSVEELFKEHIEKFLNQDTKQKELKEWMECHSKKEGE